MSAVPKFLLAALIAATLTAAPAIGQDKPIQGDERKAIIAAVRRHPAFSHLKDVKLDVRRIWASSRFAYLCVLPIQLNGRYDQKAGLYDVYQIALKREDDAWVPAARVDGYSESIKNMQCLAPADGQITDAFLETMAANPGLRP
jgi:hypothetical protein